ncbi:MAG TPA: hypothetical protein ENO09_06260 [bacterium]|nr:hypothetical protein [bacterium]
MESKFPWGGVYGDGLAIHCPSVPDGLSAARVRKTEVNMKMMKFLRVACAVVCLNSVAFVSLAQAHELENYALIRAENLPHLLHNIMRLKAELNLSAEQNAKLQVLASEVPPMMHPMFTKAELLEKKISRAVVLDGASAEAVAEELDELQKTKRALTGQQIKALNRLRMILTPEQYQHVLKEAAWTADVAQ